MGDEEDIPGEELASVTRGANGAPVAEALIGCSFYRYERLENLEREGQA